MVSTVLVLSNLLGLTRKLKKKIDKVMKTNGYF